MSEPVESLEVKMARFEWAFAQVKIDREALAQKVTLLESKFEKQAEDIDKLRTWRAQMVAVMFAGTTAISMLIKRFWN